MLELNKLYFEDCLLGMQKIDDKSIDLIISDLPFVTTSCAWDRIIPFEPLWVQYERIIKDRSAIVLFATQPFTSKLICSNLPLFKYCWTWDKGRVGGFTSAKLKPLKLFEDICVFSKGKTANCHENNMVYYPQDLVKIDKVSRSSNDHTKTGYARPSQTEFYHQEFTNYPKQLIKFTLDKERLHPTQKPVLLLEYLIKTYTKEGELILDSCVGSGTSCLAAKNLNRNFIGFENNEEYFNIAFKRIGQTL